MFHANQYKYSRNENIPQNSRFLTSKVPKDGELHCSKVSYLKVPEMWTHKVRKTSNLNGHDFLHTFFLSQSENVTLKLFSDQLRVTRFAWKPNFPAKNYRVRGDVEDNLATTNTTTDEVSKIHQYQPRKAKKKKTKQKMEVKSNLGSRA